MKRLAKNLEAIMCMSNVRGRFVKNPHQLPFSFYFSSWDGSQHGPRVKPMFNPEKLRSTLVGTLKLCEDWEYVPGPDDTSVNEKEIRKMKQFFRKYLVLFCAVWDVQIDDGILEDYFKGSLSFDDVIQSLDFYEEYNVQLNAIHDVESLEVFCRFNNLVNMYGN